MGPLLEPGETLINYFKTPSDNPAQPPKGYTFLTDRYVHLMELSVDGEVISFPHAQLRGLRVEAGYVRLVYEQAGQLFTPTFFASDGKHDCVAFYNQFRDAWSAKSG